MVRINIYLLLCSWLGVALHVYLPLMHCYFIAFISGADDGRLALCLLRNH